MPRETSGSGFVRDAVAFRYPIPTGTGADEAVTDAVFGHGYTVEKVEAFVVVAGTGASASRTMRVIKGASTVVATATVTLAATATRGAKIPFTVTSADADFLDGDTFTLDLASGGTAFTAGELQVVVTRRQRPQQRA